jgi:8-oxo-dGTP pyrophosphatase MutT (NUDIX family)
MSTSHSPGIDLEALDAVRFCALVRRLLTPPDGPASALKVHSAGPSDFDLNPGAEAELGPPDEPIPAAVLVPVIARDPLSLLLTQRTGGLAAHAGQIAFPGGKVDPRDRGALGAALREAEEEIGLEPALVEPLGCLDIYRTVTGFAITPVVALVQPGFTLSLNQREVAEAFEVPLPFLMDGANHQKHSRVYRGHARQYYAMPYGERYIWGATAGILKNMHERLFAT